MSDVDNIKARITNVNRTIADINKTNDGNIANKSLLKTQFNTGCESYTKKYGVVVDATNIKKLREDTVKEKEDELVLMEKVTSCIATGDIVQANALMGIVIEEKPVKQAQPQPQPQPQNFEPVVIVQQAEAQAQATVSQEVVGQQGVPIKPLNVIPVGTVAPQEVVSAPNHGVKIMVKAPVMATDEDDKESVKVIKTEKTPVSMGDLANIGAGGQAPNVTNNVNEFMIGIGGVPKENVSSVPTSGNALGKGLNDLINGDL